MALDVGIDNPTWWSPLCEAISSGVTQKDALRTIGISAAQLRTHTKRYPARAEELAGYRDQGLYREIYKVLPIIEAGVRTGYAPLTAAVLTGIPKWRWFAFLDHHPDIRDGLAQLQAPSTPARTRKRRLDKQKWLIQAIQDEIAELDDLEEPPELLMIVLALVEGADVPATGAQRHLDGVLDRLVELFDYRGTPP